MKCHRCSNPATLHITELVKAQVHELHLCEECAQQYLSQPSKSSASTAAEPTEEQLAEAENLVCPNCGITFKEFRAQGRLGCPHDYIAFQEELLPLIDSIHSATQHVGKLPQRAPEDSRKQFRLIQLRNELRAAVAEESYERAARLRDEIQHLEAELRP